MPRLFLQYKKSKLAIQTCRDELNDRNLDREHYNYVYFHSDNRNGKLKPFYLGKGKNDRLFSHGLIGSFLLYFMEKHPSIELVFEKNDGKWETLVQSLRKKKTF